MHKIKQLPEDFVVEEISELDESEFSKEGEYSYYLLEKKNVSFIDAINIIARGLRVKPKFINIAGTKDKIAVTRQHISIKNGPEKDFEKQGVRLKFLGKAKQRLSLGSLQGNRFTITVRNIKKKPHSIKRAVNYFDKQRFGVNRNNHIIGRSIIKKDFRAGAEEAARNDARTRHFLSVEKNNFIGALKMLDRKVLRMYVHAYQSDLWNKTASEYVKNADKNIKIPLIGFDTELDKLDNKRLKDLILKLIEDEGITLRDFIIRQMPELSAAGAERMLFAEVKELKIGNLEEDELNKGMKKCVVSFELSKGSYATQVVKQMFS